MPDNAAKVSELESLLQSGLRSHTVDGQTVTYRDQSEIMDLIQRLKRADDTNDYTVRRRVRTISLGGF
jgi:hypothetical protein